MRIQTTTISSGGSSARALRPGTKPAATRPHARRAPQARDTAPDDSDAHRPLALLVRRGSPATHAAGDFEAHTMTHWSLATRPFPAARKPARLPAVRATVTASPVCWDAVRAQKS